MKVNIETIGSWRDNYWISKNIPIHAECGGRIYDIRSRTGMICDKCHEVWDDKEFERSIDKGEVLI